MPNRGEEPGPTVCVAFHCGNGLATPKRRHCDSPLEILLSLENRGKRKTDRSEPGRLEFSATALQQPWVLDATDSKAVERPLHSPAAWDLLVCLMVYCTAVSTAHPSLAYEIVCWAQRNHDQRE